MSEKCFLVACPIFKEELKSLSFDESNIKIILMDYTIHNDAKKMQSELTNTLNINNGTHGRNSLLVGAECYCETSIVKIAGNYKAQYPNEKNCIEILLGKDKTKEKQKNRTSIITQGWVRMMNKFSEQNVNAENIRIMMGWFDQLLYIDSGVASLTDEEIINFYDLVQVPIEIEKYNLDHFQEVLNGLIY
ncbi:MAG: DUF1638 domain-containing protein [Desulfobacterales bacterium]|nr:DUF1638 domain-containing protein [Desulfobacterales bacterium]